MWRLLLRADELLDQMRADQRAAAQSALPPVVATAGQVGSAIPGYAPPPAMPGTKPSGFKLPAATGKSMVLLVAGVFLFVAASLFLAVTWQLLPLIIKASIMVGITSMFAFFGHQLNARGLRGSGETVWGLTVALIALDVSTAYRAGLLHFDRLDSRHVEGITGLLLVGLGIPAAMWALKSKATRSISAEIGASLGVFMLLTGWVFQGPWTDGPQQAVALPLVAAAGIALWSRLRWVSIAVLGLAGLTWLVLIATVAPHLNEPRATYWTHFHAWPVIVAALFAGLLALVTRLPLTMRQAAAGAGLAVFSLALWLPVHADTWSLVIASLVLIALSALALARQPLWSVAAKWVTFGVGALVAAALALLPWSALGSLPNNGLWSTTSGDIWLTAQPLGWALPLAGVAVAAALIAVCGVGVRRGLLELTAGPIAYSLAGAVADAHIGLGLVVAAFMIAAVLAVAPLALPAVRLEWPLASAFVWAGSATGLAFALAASSAWVSAVLATICALGLLAAAWRLASGRVGAVVGGFGVVMTAYAAWSWLRVADAPDTTSATTLAVVAAIALLGSRLFGQARLGLEIAAAAVALLATMLALPSGSSTAVVLTIVGSAMALSAVTDRAREILAWPASGVLALATLVRFAAAVTFPESYCLPAALVLIGFGAWRMRTSDVSSWRMLGAGLSLALLPSLLIAFTHPHSIRSLFVGLTAVLVIAVGIALRWQAPLVIGSGAALALAFRFLLPIARDLLANPFGPWLMFGVLGMTCLVIGIMWEQSLSGVRRANGYVQSLR
ncbi:MAG: hypothetical protein V9E81_07575 [Marmoricola sp.]